MTSTEPAAEATVTLPLDALPRMTPLGWRDYADRFLAASPQAQQLCRALADALDGAVEREDNRILAHQVQRHLDLAEFDAQMDGFYGDVAGPESASGA